MNKVNNDASTPDAPSAERRLADSKLKLPPAPTPLGIYQEAVRSGNLLFLTGMVPTEDMKPVAIGRVGGELDVAGGRTAARVAAINAVALIRETLGSLDKVRRLVRLSVYIATTGDVRDQPKVADGASELLQDIFGPDRNPCRLVIGVASLPLGVPVELEVIVEVDE